MIELIRSLPWRTVPSLPRWLPASYKDGMRVPARIYGTEKLIQEMDGVFVLLPMMKNHSDYLNLVTKIKPDIIAVTENDPHIEKKRFQAKEVGGKLKIISLKKTFSTSKLAKILGME